MKLFASQRFLAIYSGVLTIVFVVTVVCGFAVARNATFDQITVHRINFVEPDGTPRLVISDRAELQGCLCGARSIRARTGAMPRACSS
jgi:hypothetical protein